MPLKALIFLFPCSESYEAYVASQNAEPDAHNTGHPAGLFYMRQYARNACGTVALVHAVLNNPDIELEPGSPLYSFLERAKAANPEDRGKMFESDAAIREIHQVLATEGQTAAPHPDDEVYHHFIAFVHAEGRLYELDGSKRRGPIEHGPTTPENLLHDAVAVCKQYIERDPGEVGFSMMGLVPTQ
ncbi:ubiquitin carboxyl-terminal hydrolase-like isoform X2 [Uranotaenia lowii]|nr:ubiquitin carboxyl-terminal hydrolase-like isoform X2 [Uranotaenia lowii]XP_055589521.1 ubiquitin carboxyl-terminal hydrolase-like isoform X2 [Uranotaenia lowii]XP_055589522.1 ubiquitin carboxyl-terminal hydrolase-like isoform X2 [Uranotaenia lowii]